MSNTSDTAARLRATLGPALVGAIGGLAVGLGGLATLDTVCRNALATYTKFPSLAHPPLPFLDLPGWVVAVAAALGYVLLFVTGIPVARLARGRDTVDDLAAGTTAGLTAALAALAIGGGAVLVVACVIVPSIADLTLLSRPQPAQPGAEPTQALVDRYPDLGAVPAEERGPLVMSKIVSDQISGSVQAGAGVGTFALLGVGAPVLAGTLAAGYLRRRQYRLRIAVLTYLELTLVSALTAELVGMAVLNPLRAELAGGKGTVFAVLALVGLIAAAFLSATAAVKRWPALARVGLVLVWITVAPLAWSGTVWWPGAAVAAAALVVSWYRTHPPRTEPSGRAELTAGAQ
ncbi:hypothetical protein [Frigoriglobus tundricola]|uniref:Uncharacterized protein n=1 Tax=Frigoriglobus tundricola TaxID=2774151 RepID=A0A6M5YMW7_9BACT|nr:hypothetical protein [Frigoriglobus tundricola]QJW94571.1 hypothetical protein FTUN_2092 [Frigoriglobus tundricola]